MSAVSSEEINEGLNSAPTRMIRIVLPQGDHISGQLAQEMAGQVRHHADGRLCPVLLVITGVKSISREARAEFSESRSSSAIAVLGETPVDRVIANFLLGGKPPPCPTQFFTSEPEAMAWLKQRARGN